MLADRERYYLALNRRPDGNPKWNRGCVGSIRQVQWPCHCRKSTFRAVGMGNRENAATSGVGPRPLA